MREKKLKIRFIKLERVLVMQVLEQKGNFKNSQHVSISSCPNMGADCLFLRGVRRNLDFDASITPLFPSNHARDEQLDKYIKWISEEQFGGTGKLEVGKMCEVSDDWEEWTQRIYAGKSAKQLGEEKRFLAVNALNDNMLRRWRYAKPINDSLNVDGEIYTWETEE